MDSRQETAEIKWLPSPEDLEIIKELAASPDELDQAYAEAYKASCFVVEFGDDQGGIAAVGDLDALARIEHETGKDIDPSTLTIGNLMALGIPPSGGRGSRAENVREGLRRALERREGIISEEE